MHGILVHVSMHFDLDLVDMNLSEGHDRTMGNGQEFLAYRIGESLDLQVH